MSLVGKKAPEFSAKGVIEGKKIVEKLALSDYRGKYILLFFYPLDFTFVCPTELHAFQERLADFEERECQVLGCSVDSPFCHLAWLSTPKIEGGIQGITYPLISDLTKSIARDFGVLKEEEGIAYRGLFLLDREGVVRHQLVNDLSLGRSVDEALRLVDALQFTEKHGEVCPANWHQGEKGMVANASGVKNFFTRS